ncbi:hypothetical protein ACFFWA_37720 [Actinomadura verrucosospora]
MIHRTVFCEVSKSTAICVWATVSPDTDAMTAISAIETAVRTTRN